MPKSPLALLLALLAPALALAQALPTVVHASVLHGPLHVTPDVSQEVVRSAFVEEMAAGGNRFAVQGPSDTIASPEALFLDVFAYQVMGEYPVVVVLGRYRGKLVYVDRDTRKLFLDRERVIETLVREAGGRLAAKLDTAARPPIQYGLLTGQAPMESPMAARFMRMVPQGQPGPDTAAAPQLFSLDPAGFLSYFFQTTSLSKFNKHLKAGGPVIVFRVDPLGRSHLLEARSPREFREGDIDRLRRSVSSWPLWSTHAGPVAGVYALGWGPREPTAPRP